MLIIPVIGRLRQEEFYEFEVNLDYKVAQDQPERCSKTRTLPLQKRWKAQDQFVQFRDPCRKIKGQETKVSGIVPLGLSLVLESRRNR